MANIDKELRVIKTGRYGIDIRMDIHDALMKIAAETPSIDPSSLPNFVYIIDDEGSYITTDDGKYVVAKNTAWSYVVSIDGYYIVSSEGDYIIAKE